MDDSDKDRFGAAALGFVGSTATVGIGGSVLQAAAKATMNMTRMIRTRNFHPPAQLALYFPIGLANVQLAFVL